MDNQSLPSTIPVAEAAERTERWRTENPNGPKAFAFSIEEINTLLQSINTTRLPVIEVKALRFYLGLTAEGIPSLMVVAVGGDYNPGLQKGGIDLLETEINGETESIVFDFSCPCPYTCAEGHSALMGT